MLQRASFARRSRGRGSTCPNRSPQLARASEKTGIRVEMSISIYLFSRIARTTTVSILHGVFFFSPTSSSSPPTIFFFIRHSSFSSRPLSLSCYAPPPYPPSLRTLRSFAALRLLPASLFSLLLPLLSRRFLFSPLSPGFSFSLFLLFIFFLFSPLFLSLSTRDKDTRFVVQIKCNVIHAKNSIMIYPTPRIKHLDLRQGDKNERREFEDIHPSRSPLLPPSSLPRSNVGENSGSAERTRERDADTQRGSERDVFVTRSSTRNASLFSVPFPSPRVTQVALPKIVLNPPPRIIGGLEHKCDPRKTRFLPNEGKASFGESWIVRQTATKSFNPPVNASGVKTLNITEIIKTWLYNRVNFFFLF
ncbi:hypothetical protein PUN28_000932 [Cardiocondyla obscurior]|uniref:Transmembrane protein n=1 Tax=Cardiocondyla obscurior TaxID=286306 RepID=A0AAW2H221_9HYME